MATSTTKRASKSAPAPAAAPPRSVKAQDAKTVAATTAPATAAAPAEPAKPTKKPRAAAKRPAKPAAVRLAAAPFEPETTTLPEPAVATPPEPVLSSAPITASREDRIREAAYARFLARGMAPGDPTQDWLDAESDVDKAEAGRA